MTTTSAFLQKVVAIHEEDNIELLTKKYEIMSFEEMAERMAESNRQISQMLSTSTSMTSSIATMTTQQDEEEENDKEKRYTNMFTRAASNGNIRQVKDMLSNPEIRPFIDVNARDSDGTPSLIYAACFDKIKIAEALIDAGADVDIQDTMGWSALMWATNNSHESFVKLLLDHGASSYTKSAKGSTVFDFANRNQTIVDILSITPRESISSGTRHSITPASIFEENDEDTQDSDISEEEEEVEIMFILEEFNWNKCLPDQMFVFDQENMDSILDAVITSLKLPLSNEQDDHISANVVFLCARFAHYFSSQELLTQVLQSSLAKMNEVIRNHKQDIHVLSYWMTNASELLFFLKRDINMMIATAKEQLEIAELISDIYNLIIFDTQERLVKILEISSLEYENIKDNNVQFADDYSWNKYFNRRSVTILTPKAITNLLSSILFVLNSYNVNQFIINQLFSQLFHFISTDLFNKILKNKKLLCRSKAVQIRLNISVLQDWIIDNKLSTKQLELHLSPVIQLLQLCQCITHLTDLMDFINITKSFDLLNSQQIKRVVLNYRYEVNEARIPEEIEKYALQCVQDTIKQASNIHEQKDTTFMLPFSIPTTNQMSTHHSIPIISEFWLNVLDNVNKR